jgi:hypothetical protein
MDEKQTPGTDERLATLEAKYSELFRRVSSIEAHLFEKQRREDEERRPRDPFSGGG